MSATTILRHSLIAFALVASNVSAENIGYIPNGGVYLGRGFDVLNPQTNFPLCLSSKGECQTGVEGSIGCLSGGPPPSTGLGETTSFSIKQIHSKSEFFQEINISASLSGSYGPFSGSGSFSSTSLDQINQESLSWMISVKGYYGSFALIDPTLTQANSKLSGPEILSKCGPQYVSTVQRGVVAVALFTVYNLDEQHFRQVQASMSAGFSTGAFGAAGSADFSSVLKTALQYGSMSINVFTIGGQGDPSLSALVNAKPTDLDAVKQILTSYVQAQDIAHSAIVGFQTTALGKLINDPSIDPDQSMYLYFVESANSYRMDLQDGLTKVDGLLVHALDFDTSVQDKANSLKTQLNCELGYIGAAINSCQLATNLARQTLAINKSTPEAAARSRIANSLPLRYGLASNSGPIKVCTQQQVNSAAIGPNQFATPGWVRKGTSDLNSPECKGKVEPVLRQYVAMLRSASEGPICVSSCSFDPDDNLLASVNQLPKFPFSMLYYYDDGSGGVAGTTNPGLYVALTNASNISEVRFYKDQDQDAFGIRSNSGASFLSIFIDLKTNSVTGPVRVEVGTVNNNTYVITIPFVKPL
jgi:hypothetical protein